MRREPARMAALAACCLFASGPLRGQEVSGRVRGTYQSSEGEAESFDSVLQSYEINFRNRVAPGLSYLARVRALASDLNPEVGAASGTDLLEPFLQIVYEGEHWQMSGSGRRTRSRPEEDRDLESVRRDYIGRLAWSAEDRPRFDLLLSRLELTEAERLDSVEDRSLATLAYGGALGSTQLGIENRMFDDQLTDFTRDTVQINWSGDLRGAFAGGRVTLEGRALAFEGRTEEETPRAILVDEQRRAFAGLYADDPTPLSGTLSPTPALIDGDLASPAADLSGDFRNFGVDLNTPQSVDAVFLTVERRPLPGNDREYAWDVYTSADGNLWSLAVAGAVTDFEELQNRFEIRFATLTARYLKVVNPRFSRDEPPLAATEIQVFGAELRSGRAERQEGRRNLTLSAGWRPRSNVDVGLTTLAGRQTIDNGEHAVDRDYNHTLTTTVRTGALATTLRLQAIDRDYSQAVPEDDRLASLGFALSPLPRLDLSLVGTHRRNSSPEAVLVESDAVNARVGARFLDDLEVSLDLGWVDQTEDVVERTTRRRNALVAIVTRLRPELIFTGTWSAERQTTESPQLSDARTNLDLRSRLSYRPTPVFGGAVELLYQDLATGEGFAHLYDVDWLPFPGGALQIQISLVQDRRSITGERRDESRLGARWTLNPRLLLETSFTRITSGAEDAQASNLATVFLEWRF